MMNDLNYVHMSGSGNTFLILDLCSKERKKCLEKLFSHQSFSEITQKICKIQESDGAVFLLPSPPVSKVDFIWDFYNKDGSSADMCGNAARSVACFAYAYKYKKRKNQISFKMPHSKGGVKAVVSSENEAQIQMSPVKLELWNQTLPTKAFDFKGFSLPFLTYHVIQSGVPHTVIEWPEKQDTTTLLTLSRLLRKDKRFTSKKTNLTYYGSYGFLTKIPQKVFDHRTNTNKDEWRFNKKNHESTEKQHRIEAISFERGIESFTQACGTGAVAAAYAYHKKHSFSPAKVLVSMPGGVLEVDLSQKPPLLRGQVSVLKEGPVKDLTKTGERSH